MNPTTGQLVLLAISVTFFALGAATSLARIWSTATPLRLSAKIFDYLGLTAAVAVIIWHSIARGHWQPMNDNFDSLIWLAILLALFVAYVQRVKPIRGLDWFVMPIVIVLLVAAGFFGSHGLHIYQPLVRDAGIWLHRVTAYGGAVAFAIAAPVGAMYVIASRRLRAKAPGPVFTSLERLERLMMLSVTLGFALLTIGLITGLFRMFVEGSTIPMAKLLLASLAWLVYAVVMHAPINPRFRGRRAALLSIFGFVLVFGTLVAVQLMPTGGNG
jgi:ABC-type uncharacterized transport system permease subunit